MVLVTTFAASDASIPRGESNSGRNAITGAVADRVGMGDAAPGGMKLSGHVRDDLAKRKREPRFLWDDPEHAEPHEAWMLVMDAVGRAAGYSG
jgi:hypothetical protein